MIQRKIQILILLLFPLVINAQSFDNEQLKTKSYEALSLIYQLNNSDTVYANRIANVYLKRALKEKDSIKIAIGFSNLAYVSKPSKAIKYLDSAIVYSQINNKVYPGLFYLNKAQYLFNNNEYEKSLNNAITAYNHATIQENIDQQISALYQINLVNELWGDYRKVLDTGFFIEKLVEKNKLNENSYLQSLHALEGIGNCYVRLKKPDSALIYFNKGIKKTLKNKDSTGYLKFVSRTGMALTIDGKYEKALDSLYKANENKLNKNSSYLTYFYYYAGKCHYYSGEEKKGIDFFMKIDSIYELNHILSPELPDVYDKLINYYKKNNDDELQVKYLYKLIQVERIIDVKRSQIKAKTNTEYHIPKILQEKENLITELSTKNKNFTKITAWVVSLFIISIGYLFYYIKRQRKFKKRYLNLINQQETNKKSSKKNSELNSGISIDVIEDILKQLAVFEEKKYYLKSNISMNGMAKKFGTNSTYLSKVINLKKDKNFSQYINDLRVDYAIEQFEINPKFKKYTIKAIAGECGFKNAESFSKAFYKKWGIYPSYYIKQIIQKQKD